MEFIGEVPTDAQDDNLGIEVATLEELVEAQELAHVAPHSRGERRTSV
jgi:hypothetical protein